jgi:hypothetical protein
MGCLCSKDVLGCLRSEAQDQEPHHEPEVVGVPHTRNMSNHYVVHYPAHEPRKNSAIYNKTHKKMKDLPCFICGKTNEADGIHVETHHFFVQKAFQNVIDWKKFGDFADKCQNLHTGELMGTHFDWEEVALNPDLFVDSPFNMVVLCKEHHTSGGRGIHHVPFPEWIAQKFVKEGVVVLGLNAP